MKTRYLCLIWLAMAVVVVLLNSCKYTRDATKQTQRTEQTVTTSHDLTKTVNDQTVTTTTERTKDTVVTPPINMTASGIGTSVQSVVNGDTLNARYDPVRNTLDASFRSSGKKVAVNKETVTEQRNNVQTAVIEKNDSTGTTDTNTTNKVVAVKRTTSWWWLIVLAGVAVGGYFGWRWFKRTRPP